MGEMLAFSRNSEELLEATLELDAQAVAEGIEKIHMDILCPRIIDVKRETRRMV